MLASDNSADKILKRLCIKLSSLRNISGDNVSMYILLFVPLLIQSTDTVK